MKNGNITYADRIRKEVFCYLIRSKVTPSRTYVGMTIDPPRRLKQHNGTGSNGARFTRVGRPWEFVCWVKGFFNIRQALQFEWMWKKIRVKSVHSVRGHRLRMLKLSLVLGKNK
jgi:structure-specific endonuclease subunit SLX1